MFALIKLATSYLYILKVLPKVLVLLLPKLPKLPKLHGASSYRWKNNPRNMIPTIMLITMKTISHKKETALDSYLASPLVQSDLFALMSKLVSTTAQIIKVVSHVILKRWVWDTFGDVKIMPMIFDFSIGKQEAHWVRSAFQRSAMDNVMDSLNLPHHLQNSRATVP